MTAAARLAHLERAVATGDFLSAEEINEAAEEIARLRPLAWRERVTYAAVAEQERADLCASEARRLADLIRAHGGPTSTHAAGARVYLPCGAGHLTVTGRGQAVDLSRGRLTYTAAVLYPGWRRAIAAARVAFRGA